MHLSPRNIPPFETGPVVTSWHSLSTARYLLKNPLSSLLVVGLLLLIVGCGSDDEQPSSDDGQANTDNVEGTGDGAPNENDQTSSAEQDGTLDSEDDDAGPAALSGDPLDSGDNSNPDDSGDNAADQDTTNIGQDPAPTDVRGAADTPEAVAPLPVTLGAPELTAGIPGDGPLTSEDIRGWLADDDRHRPLAITLPRGLASGASQIQIPADNPMTLAKIELGRQLYFDRRLSADGKVSCADCHHPDEGYARHTQFGVGIDGQEGGRNSPISYNRILSGPQFWDGRAANLEEQAIGPIANPIEMGNTHEEAVETLRKIEGYSLQFDRIFEDGVTIENVGKAIATFERAIVTGPSPYDYYEPLRAMETALGGLLDDIAGLREDDPDLFDDYMAVKEQSDLHPMSASAKRGRELFFGQKAGCTACHVGANLTDEKYHNLGVGFAAESPDLGRFVITEDEKDRGGFKTPTIRNVAHSAPYMHDGSQKDLAEVVRWYNDGGHPNPNLAKEIRKLGLSPEQINDLVAFMEACSGEFPEVQRERLPE